MGYFGVTYMLMDVGGVFWMVFLGWTKMMHIVPLKERTIVNNNSCLEIFWGIR